MIVVLSSIDFPVGALWSVVNNADASFVIIIITKLKLN